MQLDITNKNGLDAGILNTYKEIQIIISAVYFTNLTTILILLIVNYIRNGSNWDKYVTINII